MKTSIDKKWWFGILSHMAVLWKQRELVRELDIITKKTQRSYKGQVLDGTINTRIHLAVILSGGEYWLYENELLNRMLKKHKKSKSDVDFIINYKRTLESCIKDGFIEQRENENFYVGESTDENVLEYFSERFIEVSYDKGAELINGTYFWWKYMAGIFPSRYR